MPKRAKPAAAARHRSELECFVLGLVWQLGPVSPYDIRVHMQASPSTQWSASAGAIYPLITRLHGEGLLRARETANGRRRRSEYSITAAGLRVLRAWIGPPLPAEAVTVTYDPLRSRARFLGALEPAERAAWCEGAQRALDEIERRVRDWEEAYGRSIPRAALLTRSGEIEVQGRRRWLGEVRRSLQADGSRAG